MGGNTVTPYALVGMSLDVSSADASLRHLSAEMVFSLFKKQIFLHIFRPLSTTISLLYIGHHFSMASLYKGFYKKRIFCCDLTRRSVGFEHIFPACDSYKPFWFKIGFFGVR